MLLNIRIFPDHFGLAPEKSTLLKLLCALRGENLSWILLDFAAAKWYFARQSTASGSDLNPPESHDFQRFGGKLPSNAVLRVPW
ncbi:MAG: hypothetical protein E7663_02180 [Ruminococcaceae bacterium]|nr:hypothetical protein [Oscillospiraceae bacterium]